MIKKMSNELWYSTITSKGYPTAELAEEAETRVYAGVLNRAYSVRNWIAQYTALCEMYEKDCNKGDRSNEAVFNEYEPKFDSIIQTLYEAGVNKLDGCSLIDVLNSNRPDDVDYEDDEDDEDDEPDEVEDAAPTSKSSLPTKKRPLTASAKSSAEDVITAGTLRRVRTIHASGASF